MARFVELLEKLRQRPGMYLGEGFALTRLQSFIAGYDIALYERGIAEEKQESLFPLPFHFFFEFVALRLVYVESTSGWRNMILEQVHGDEEEGLALFFQLWDRLNRLAIQRCDRMVLTKRNLWYHRTSAAEEELQDCFGALSPWQSIPEQEIVLNGERVME